MSIQKNETKQDVKILHIWRTGQTYTLQKGPIYRKEFTNLYFSLLPQPVDEKVIQYYDVRKPLPYVDNTFDCAYAMHVIEHLSPKEGADFVREVRRVLKPQSIFRVSTPDLEDIIRNYFKQFKKCWDDRSDKNIRNYHWSMLEIFDQLARRRSGGEMVDAMKEKYYDEDYLKERYGDVYQEFIPQKERMIREQIQAQRAEEIKQAQNNETILEKFKRKVQRKIYQYRLEKMNQRLQGDPRKILEFNKWMYDRLSLKFLMEEAGFIEYQVKNHKESDIKNWQRYRLDQSSFGENAIEPSIYVEGKKP